MDTRAPEGPGPWYQGDPQTGWPPAPRTPLPGSTLAGPGRSRTPGSGLGARTIAALVAAGLALVGLGFGAGYVVRGAGKTGAGTTSTSTHQSSPRGAVWQFTPLSANTVCGGGGDRKVVAALKSEQQGSVPPRLSDQTPRTSALGGYRAVSESPVDPGSVQRPWERVYTRFGAITGFARSFNVPNHPGGFATYAYQFPNPTAATAAAAAAYGVFVCEFGADPLRVSGHPGIVVGSNLNDSIAWWVQGARVVSVDYSMWGQRGQDLANALVAVQATWMFGHRT